MNKPIKHLSFSKPTRSIRPCISRWWGASGLLASGFIIERSESRQRMESSGSGSARTQNTISSSASSTSPSDAAVFSTDGRPYPLQSAIRAIVANPECGEPLKRELDGLRKYRVRRFRIVYTVDQKKRIIRLMAVGHSRSVYEKLADQHRQKSRV